MPLRGQGPNPDPGAETRSPGREALLLAGIVLLCLLPFLGKAFHIDDPFFLWVAKQIQRQPWNFYGFEVNWYGVPAPAAEINQNPPLVSFYLALAAALFGWSERALHGAFLLPAVAAVLAVYALARRLCAQPLLAAAASFFTPVFFVSSTTLMTDVSMVAFYCGALFFWIRGVEEGRGRDLLLAAFLAGLCVLSKYFGFTLIPLMAAYAAARRHPPARWALPLALPLLMLLLYEWYTLNTYGQAHFATAVSYALGSKLKEGSTLWERGLSGLVYTGGCVLPLLVFIPFLRSRLLLAAGGVAGLGLCLSLLGAGHLGGLSLGAGPLRLQRLAHAWVFTFGSVFLLLLVLQDLRRFRDARSLLLALWVGGTLAFALFANWTTNARSVLPLMPAAGILVGRLVPPRPWKGRRWGLAALLLPGLGLSFLVASADADLADSAREAASRVAVEHRSRPGRFFFTGHWGFQYYMESLGAKAVNAERQQFQAGDFVVAPYNNTNIVSLPRFTLEEPRRLEIPVNPRITTMHLDLGAGFYMSQNAPFPYVFGAVGPERYEMMRVKRPFYFVVEEEGG